MITMFINYAKKGGVGRGGPRGAATRPRGPPSNAQATGSIQSRRLPHTWGKGEAGSPSAAAAGRVGGRHHTLYHTQNITTPTLCRNAVHNNQRSNKKEKANYSDTTMIDGGGTHKQTNSAATPVFYTL